MLEMEQRFGTEDACRQHLIQLRSATRGKLFFRLLEQAVQVEPVTYDQIIHGGSKHKP